MEIVSSGLVDNVTNLGDLKKETKYIKINLPFSKGKGSSEEPFYWETDTMLRILKLSFKVFIFTS